MKFLRKNNWAKDEFVGKLTQEIDQNYTGHIRDGILFSWHYILDVRDSMDKDLFVIRVPGRTIGNIRIDDQNRIKEIIIDNDYHPNNEPPRYPDNINDILSKYIGEEVELEDTFHQ